MSESCFVILQPQHREPAMSIQTWHDLVRAAEAANENPFDFAQKVHFNIDCQAALHACRTNTERWVVYRYTSIYNRRDREHILETILDHATTKAECQRVLKHAPILSDLIDRALETSVALL